MKALRFLWRWSPLVTFPVAVLTVLFAANVYGRWQTFGLRAITAANYSLRGVGEMEAAHLKRKAATASLGMGLQGDLSASGLRTLHLIVPESNLARLFARLPGSGRNYVDGGLFKESGDPNGNQGLRLQEVKLRLRGDSDYHWGYWKKSWRIKTDREALFEGMRKFNLVAPRTPEQYNNHLGHRLATYLDLLAPRSEIVAATLNQDFMGLYQLTEQIEESTIRRAGCMPGDVYSGDIGGRVSYREIQEMELFQHPGTWEKVAVNNHYEEAAIAPLEALLDLVTAPSTEENQTALGRLVDIPSFARFSAFEALAGTVHNDSTHNWRLYYDPWATRFQPIAWDPVAWHSSWRPKAGQRLRTDVISSPLHLALFHNGDFLRERERAFGRFFGEGADDAFLTEVRDVLAAADQVVDHDPHMVVNMSILEPNEVRHAWDVLQDLIRSLFDRQREAHLGAYGSGVELVPVTGIPGGPRQFWLRLSGRRQLDSMTLTFDDSLDQPLGLTVEWLVEGQTQGANLDSRVRGVGNELELKLGLLPKVNVIAPNLGASSSPSNHLVFEPGTYLLSLRGPESGSRVVAASARFVDDTPLRVTLEDEVASAPELVNMGPVRRLVPGAPTSKPTIWSGDVELVGDVLLEDLVLRPGTRVRCAPGANLLVTGRLTAHGTAEEPIHFGPQSPGQAPWGTVALKGAGASGSTLEHCHFEGGSGWKAPLFEYSAMVSIHGAKGVVFRHTTFRDSQVVDDMVHGVYSEILFDHCRFIGSPFDALDMDISRVEIRGCHFEKSGNDALDLMTSSAAVLDTLFMDSQDKGISVGEKSSLFLVESSIQSCAFGIQVKDESVALVSHVDFMGNETAVDAYKKNWRYSGGGALWLTNCWLEGNASAAGLDAHSSLRIAHSFVDRGLPVPGKGTLSLGPGMATGSALSEHRAAEGIDLEDAANGWSMSGAWYRPYLEGATALGRGRSAPVK